MSAPSPARPGTPAPKRRSRPGRPAIAGLVAATVGIGAAVLVAGADAAAAAAPRSQAVGRFLDGSAGGQPLESVVDVKDARATNPGNVTDRNPLDVTVAKQLDLPLTGALQLPGSGNAVHFGAANQVAVARSDGYAYGAAGAVADSGGASIGGGNGYPSTASIDLSPDALPSPGSLPLPGAGSLPALGEIKASVGAVSALAHTPANGGHATTKYGIASLTLSIDSPALGGVLKQIGDALKAPTLPGPGTSPLPLPTPVELPGLPDSCSFKTQVLSPLVLDGGAVTIDPTSGALTVDLAAVLKQLGLNLNRLPANTDLLAYLLKYLSSSDGLAKGVQDTLHGVLDPLQANFTKCVTDFKDTAFPAPLKTVADSVLAALTGGQTQVQDALTGVVDKLTAAGGSNPLAPLASGLQQLIGLGVNVQPNGARGSFASKLRATPNQATPVVARQTIVRAIEIDLLPAGGSQAPVLALANAAAGPSTRAVDAVPPVTSSPAAPAGAPNTQLPTGIPAGRATPATPSSPALPLALLAFALVMAGGGAVAWRLRSGRHGS